MQRIAAALLVLISGVFTVAHAQDAEESPWSGDTTLGYLKSTGNTDDSTADFDFNVAYTTKPWVHELRGRAFGTSSDNSTTAESYQLAWKSTYDLSDVDYLFGGLAWNKDRFSGFTRQTFASTGYGRRLLNDETFTLNVEVGVGYTKQRTNPDETLPNPEPAETQDNASGTLGGDFTWNISENAAFEQNFYLFVTSDNNFLQSVSKLTSNITGGIGLALSYTVRKNSDVPAGSDKTDTLTSIGLNYSF